MNTTEQRAEARSRANRRLRNMTIGTAILAVAATGSLGWAAAITYNGASTQADLTAAVVTTTVGDTTATDATSTTSSTRDDLGRDVLGCCGSRRVERIWRRPRVHGWLLT